MPGSEYLARQALGELGRMVDLVFAYDQFGRGFT